MLRGYFQGWNSLTKNYQYSKALLRCIYHSQFDELAMVDLIQFASSVFYWMRLTPTTFRSSIESGFKNLSLFEKVYLIQTTMNLTPFYI